MEVKNLEDIDQGSCLKECMEGNYMMVNSSSGKLMGDMKALDDDNSDLAIKSLANQRTLPHRELRTGVDSRWEEFRKFVSRDADTEECSNLLKRMELEALDDEDKTLNDEDMISLEESGLLRNIDLEGNRDQDEVGKKAQKRKTGWGPILRIPRPRRVPDDGRTVLQRAQELKKVKNLEKGAQVEGPKGILKIARMLQRWISLMQQETS
ncbi:uncharacterized protein LOC110430052 [Sorghum bicolor]|uniref:uncharacterized protein LOC110430052 n=1 Tax=Sorghum bicolor TaxID=4558 RepID=UPI000B424044|nr:uncharacterized protein LOC110430052 [Sorghum bicolor]|eukprot:XP_021302584.1 uncharacterized protein LOC110430052 [Sorghum bicolor]